MLSSLNTGKGGPNNQFNASIFKAVPGTADASTGTTEGTASLGNIPRDAGRAPKFAQVDLSFMKRTPIGNKWSTEFRADLFNIANHPNFANPDGILTDPTFGDSLSTINQTIGIGSSRQIQFSLKIIR